MAEEPIAEMQGERRNNLDMILAQWHEEPDHNSSRLLQTNTESGQAILFSMVDRRELDRS